MNLKDGDIDPVSLMDLHVRCLYTHDELSRTIAVNEPDNKSISAAYFHLGRTRSGNIWRLNAALDAELAEDLIKLCREEVPLGSDLEKPPRHASEYLRRIEGHLPIHDIASGPVFRFSGDLNPRIYKFDVVAVTSGNAEVLTGNFDEFVPELPTWQPFAALLKDGRAVSICRSSRITPEAHEAGLETHPNHRGRGYALEVARFWAAMVYDLGAIPLYSTSWTNAASRAVARKLGLECFGADYEIG